MSVAYGKGAKGKATRLHSQLIRSRGRCEHCGSTFRLEAAHIIGRRYSATRTDERNAFCLCSSCHRRFTDHADEWLAFIDITIGRDEYDRLKHKALSNLRPWKPADWEAEVARLRGLLGEVAA